MMRVIGAVGMLILAGGLLVILTRFGLLASVVVFPATAMTQIFFTTEFDAWYGQASFLTILTISAVAFFGFKIV